MKQAKNNLSPEELQNQIILIGIKNGREAALKKLDQSFSALKRQEKSTKVEVLSGWKSITIHMLTICQETGIETISASMVEVLNHNQIAKRDKDNALLLGFGTIRDRIGDGNNEFLREVVKQSVEAYHEAEDGHVWRVVSGVSGLDIDQLT